MKLKFLIVVPAILFMVQVGFGQSAFDKMTNDKMNKILQREVDEVLGVPGRWQAQYKGRTVYVLTDAEFNRMRIFSPVIEVKDIKKGEYRILLEANFDKALDAKYSIYDDVLWATYTHPLAELTVEQFKDAMKQVVLLATNYGTSYTSTDFTFGTGN